MAIWTPRRRAHRRRHPWARVMLLGVLVPAITLPPVWTVLASFGVTPDIATQPPSWTWPPSVEHYAEVVVAVPGFPQAFANSVMLATTSTLLAMGVAFLAAYSLARLRFRGKRLLVQSFLVLATLPMIAYVTPLSEIARHLRLQGTFVGIALADAAVYTPLALYILYGYVVRVSPTLEEAARLEGASILQVLWQVVAPATASGLAASAVLVFAPQLDALLVPPAAVILDMLVETSCQALG